MSSLALARDVDVGSLLLQAVGVKLGRKGIVRVDQRVTDGSLERTIDGASTLTLNVEDADRALLRSGMFSRQMDLQFDGEWWRLVQVAKSGDGLTLTFEDRAVAYLRAITTPRKAARSSMTRAEFALSIVREVKQGGGIPFVSPDLHTVQPIEKASDTTTTPTTAPSASTNPSAAVSQGIAASADVTVKGVAATASQRGYAQRVMDVASSLSAGTRATLALLEACTVESLFSNPTTPSADGYGSRGILQVRDSTGSSMGITNTDVEQCVNAFLTRGFTGAGGAITLAAKNPSWTTGQVAQGVQGSAYPGRYDQYQTEAEKWLGAYGGIPGGGASSGGTVNVSQSVKTLPYQFQRGTTDGSTPPEDSWTCLQRLASEVQWRCFMSGGALWFVSEATLMKSRPVATLSELVLGVDTIDFDVDNGKANSEATVTARILRTSFVPGAVVALKDCGPADGRWLVKDVTRGVFDPLATITLKRETEPLPEPAADTTTVGGTGSSVNGDSTFTPGTVTGGSPLAQAWSAAQDMDAKRYPYVWGGGHARAGTPDRGTGRDPGIGYDCSGSTCAVLAAASMGYELGGPVDVSGTIAAKWGHEGPGNGLTVYANAIHVFMVFHTSSGDRHFGTGNWGKSWGGPGFNPELHPTAGFTPRHWPGT